MLTEVLVILFQWFVIFRISVKPYKMFKSRMITSMSVQEKVMIVEEAFRDGIIAIEIIHLKDHIVVCISTWQFIEYMTDNDDESTIVFNIVEELYPTQKPASRWIDSRIFKELFMNHRRKFNLSLSVKEFAELRKEKTRERIKQGIANIHNSIEYQKK
ncbi:uncharacterized protein LOC126837899 [Adelges cooleyi]|uniref:uncharacterized protein LOC126837899 n=1 Tax=Adelges cooleyi TaxID=133065 RepID=UPI0021802474|nr:uncharacterized protein LOC126837899 [Adelges cooleyi]